MLADGNQVRLWEDKWACSRTLQEKFSRLYSLSICKDRVISNVGVWVQTECGKILWRHERLMWEKVHEQQLLQVLETNSPKEMMSGIERKCKRSIFSKISLQYIAGQSSWRK